MNNSRFFLPAVAIIPLVAWWLWPEQNVRETDIPEGKSTPTVPQVRERIAVTTERLVDLKTADEASLLHHDLLLKLMDDLEALRQETHPGKIRIRLEATADQFVLFRRAMKIREIAAPDLQTLPRELEPRIESLVLLWSENQILSTEADRIFSRLNLLDCEHVPYLLRNSLEP